MSKNLTTSNAVGATQPTEETNKCALALVATHDAAQATELNRDFSRASLARAKENTFVGPSHYRDAARVMGRILSPETQARLSAICTANFSDLPESILQWLEQLASEIIA